jgi:hypothetical protein
MTWRAFRFSRGQGMEALPQTRKLPQTRNGRSIPAPGTIRLPPESALNHRCMALRSVRQFVKLSKRSLGSEARRAARPRLCRTRPRSQGHKGRALLEAPQMQRAIVEAVASCAAPDHGALASSCSKIASWDRRRSSEGVVQKDQCGQCSSNRQMRGAAPPAKVPCPGERPSSRLTSTGTRSPSP